MSCPTMGIFIYFLPSILEGAMLSFAQYINTFLHYHHFVTLQFLLFRKMSFTKTSFILTHSNDILHLQKHFSNLFEVASKDLTNLLTHNIKFMMARKKKEVGVAARQRERRGILVASAPVTMVTTTLDCISTNDYPCCAQQQTHQLPLNTCLTIFLPSISLLQFSKRHLSIQTKLEISPPLLPPPHRNY